jgi:hypothetical protein
LLLKNDAPSPHRRVAASFLAGESGYIYYIVVVVLSILGTLSYITITNRGQTQILASRELAKLQTSLLAESGIKRAEYYLNGNDGKNLFWETSASGIEESLGTSGSLHLTAQRFGVFEKISSTGTRLAMSCIISGVAGRDVPEILLPALTMTGQIPGLIIDNSTAIDGKVVLSNGFVYRGKERGKVMGAEKWVTIRQSPDLPFDIAPIRAVLDTLGKNRIAWLSDSNAIRGDVVIDNSGDSLLKRDRVVIVGNCTIRGIAVISKTISCAGVLSIEDSTRCVESSFLSDSLAIKNVRSEMSLFFSEKVLHIDGGNHNSQFISNDTIFVQKNAGFGQLSAWISHRIIKKDSVVSGSVVFEREGTYNGNCLCFSDSAKLIKQRSDRPVISLGRKSVYCGTIITDGDIDFQECTINGHVWAKVIKTVNEKGELYINYVFKSRISAPKTEPPFMLAGEAPVRLRFEGEKRVYVHKK